MMALKTSLAASPLLKTPILMTSPTTIPGALLEALLGLAIRSREEMFMAGTAGAGTAGTTSKPLQRELQKLLTDATGTTIPASKARSQSKAAIDDEDETPNGETTGPLEVHYIYNTSLASDPGEPRTYKLAMSGPKQNLWVPAIKSKIGNFYKREVWKRVPKSQLKGRRTLGTRWVFKKKNEQNGLVRYKARLVVKGYVQIPGLDFTDSFAPVATDTSVCVLFAIALYYKEWTIEVIDVEAAFLEADLEEAVYIDWPEGVTELGFESANDFETTASDLIRQCTAPSKPLCNGSKSLWRNC